MLGCRVVDVKTAAGGRRVDTVVAVRDDGHRVAVRAEKVVLATGGIENARLLLLADGGRGLGNRHDLVGRYFAERMLFTAGHLRLEPASRFDADQFGPTTTVSGALRVVDDVQRELGLHNCTLHLTSRADFMASASAQSISTLRKALGRRPLLPHLAPHAWNSVTAVGQLPGLARRAVGRGRRTLVVSHMGEQAPNPDSRVRLGTRKDDLGMPVARVTWQLTDADRRAAERSVRVLGDALRAGGSGEVRWTAQLDRTTLVTGAHHHLGTTRMHEDPRHGVVDGDARVHELENLYVAGSSVFPTYGASNPTLTVIALAIRLADHLGESLGRPPAAPDELTRPWVWTSGRGRRAGAPREPGQDRRPAGR
jgi:choline dehydrogenase-like flavoprotein